MNTMKAAVESVKMNGITMQVSADKVWIDGWVSVEELLAARKLVVKALRTAGFRVFAVKHNGYPVWWTRDYDGRAIDRRCGVRVEVA